MIKLILQKFLYITGFKTSGVNCKTSVPFEQKFCSAVYLLLKINTSNENAFKYNCTLSEWLNKCSRELVSSPFKFLQEEQSWKQDRQH